MSSRVSAGISWGGPHTCQLLFGFGWALSLSRAAHLTQEHTHYFYSSIHFSTPNISFSFYSIFLEFYHF